MMFLIHRNVVHAQCMWRGRQSNVQYKKKLAHFVSVQARLLLCLGCHLAQNMSLGSMRMFKLAHGKKY